MPKISIIVPVYNVEIYLKQCMDSLLRQTMSDLEFICINDGSTDSSLDILKEYATKDQRIRLISKGNEGYGKTMNRGLAEATAAYIGIVESDDFVKADMFEKLYKTMEEKSVDLVKCNFYKYTVEDGEDIEYSREYDEAIYGKIFEPIDYPDIFSANSSIWAALYSKEFLDKNEIRFNETPGASFQDISFHFKVLNSARRMTVIKDPLIYYRTDNVMSSVHSPSKIYCICDEIHSIEEYIMRQPKARQERLWPFLTKRKYYDYHWNYYRLASVFQFAFYEKMIAEFQKDKELGRFENIAWTSPSDEEEFKRMMGNPQRYFMDTVKQYRDSRISMANTQNGRLAEIGLFALLNTVSKIVIYGAGKVGRYVAERLQAADVPKEKLTFAVTDLQDIEHIIDGVPVKQIDEAAGEPNKDRLILVAVKGEKQITMLNYLIYLGCNNIVIADDEVLSYLY